MGERGIAFHKVASNGKAIYSQVTKTTSQEVDQARDDFCLEGRAPRCHLEVPVETTEEAARLLLRALFAKEGRSAHSGLWIQNVGSSKALHTPFGLPSPSGGVNVHRGRRLAPC